jgi:signal transduction histidine kinase
VNLAEGLVHWSDEVAAIHETPPGFSPSLTEGIHFYAPEWRERISIVFDACVRDGKAYDEELQIITAQGRRVWVRAIGEAVRDASGAISGVQGAFQDITGRKQAEEALRELNSTLEQRVQERTGELRAANQELEAFAYAVSHDLRQPLRAMNGFSQALLEDYGTTLPVEAREFLDEIIRGSHRMGDLIDGLLRLSRSTRGELRRDAVDLSAAASRILGGLAAADSNRHVAWSIDPGLTVQGDERMIDVVLDNLLGNAWKYTAHRADAVIEVGVQDSEALTPRDGFSCFFVRDNGAGFDMRHAEKLFQPFQRLHREDEFPGIGIGLATVQRIIHRHGGEIKASSAPGQGATFSFSLPSKNINEDAPP